MPKIDGKSLLIALDKQRRALKMPLDVLAERAELSRATVCRILQEKRASSSLANVLAIAGVLGARPAWNIQKPDDLVEQQVQEQAKKIAQMVQGTMALESQGLTDPRHLDVLVETAAKEIRAKPRGQLWARQRRASNPSRAKRPSQTSRS